MNSASTQIPDLAVTYFKAATADMFKELKKTMFRGTQVQGIKRQYGINE